MIRAEYYQLIYFFIILVISIKCFSKYKFLTFDRLDADYREDQSAAISLTVFLILFIGTRPISGKVFLDMESTASCWFLWNQGSTFHFRWGYENKIYDNLRALMSTYNMPVELFFILIAIIYFGCIYIACKKIFPKNTLFALLVYLAAFSSFSYGTNGIKAGSAASLFLIALAYTENWKIVFPMILVSWGFHHSMIMVVCSFICIYYYRKTKYYFYFWIFAFFIALFHITFFQNIFAKFSDEQGAEYLKQVIGGFRLDFIVYSAVPVIIGYYIIFVKKLKISTQYEILLNLYLMTNSIWMLCMYAEFTNRIAYMSWFIHPWVMIYPFLNEKIDKKQYQIVSYIAMGHLCFTLFLNFIYW